MDGYLNYCGEQVPIKQWAFSSRLVNVREWEWRLDIEALWPVTVEVPSPFSIAEVTFCEVMDDGSPVYPLKLVGLPQEDGTSQSPQDLFGIMITSVYKGAMPRDFTRPRNSSEKDLVYPVVEIS
jgi:hypothetical protein